MSNAEWAFWQRVNGVLLQALERSPEERREFLDRACVGDDSVRREVDSLLTAENETGPPIDPLVANLLAPTPATLKAGERIGPYEIVQEIGRGGTGAVYLARPPAGGPLAKVAIKVLKRGMDTDEVLRAFEQERRILANLDHPSIVRFFESGVTEDHRPYLVMELIDGEPIDQYCDRRSLSVQDRLEIFLKVCSAVQLAHQNLVIHRDLKPSNILVTADGEPKLLDFGIAKLLDPDQGAENPATAAWRRLMTPCYASPEQVLGQPMSTTSDVYSLGVILYELLTGRR
ncbi:MAG: serine/threonine protein kinase, partial [Acidobacteria bacterium]|nr:serine/threonine protein kinase [Acidobacteriota bacterium]